MVTLEGNVLLSHGSVAVCRLVVIPKIDFSHSPAYAVAPGGISVPFTLTSGAASVDVLSYIDTGASNCLFERGHGRMWDLLGRTGWLDRVRFGVIDYDRKF